MTPLQKLEAAAEAYTKAAEARLRMNRNNSTSKDRSAVTKRQTQAKAEFQKLVAQHPNEIVKLFRSYRRLQQGLVGAASYPTEFVLSEATKIVEQSREILP